MSRRTVTSEFEPEEQRRLDEEERQQKNQAAQEREDLRLVLGTPEGFRALERLVDKTGIWERGYVHSGSENYFKQGKASFGLEMISDIARASSNSAAAMMKAALPGEIKDE